MSNFARRQNHKYVVVDFDKVTERGLKKLIDALKRAKSPVTSVEATNKKSRKDSVMVKKAKFFFENGQSMTLFIGSEGDIYQLTLNATKQPLPNANSERELATHMSKLMARNQAKFDKAQARKLKATTGPVDSAKPLSRGLKARLAETQSRLSDVQANHAQITTSHATLKAQSEASLNTISSLEAALASEKADTAALEQELKELS